LKGTTMQLQVDDTGSSERLLRQIGEEHFVDKASSRDANRTLLVPSGVDRYHHAAQHALGPYWHLWTVVEATSHLAFRTLLDLIRGQLQTRLDKRVIEHAVVFAAGDKGETSPICEHSSGAIVSVEPQQ